jgi:hypothetical protein
MITVYTDSEYNMKHTNTEHRSITCYSRQYRSRGSSGNTVSDYGLDGRTIGVRSPAGAKDFSSNLCVQAGSGAHPASCTMGTWGPFPGGKPRPGRDADHSPPSSAEVVNEEEPYLLSPPSASMACRGTALL